MTKIYSFNDFLDEEFSFKDITRKFKKLFSTDKDATELVEKITKYLNKYRNELIANPETIDRKELVEVIKKLEKQISYEIVVGLNLDTFLRGIYNVLLTKKNKEKKINKYFDDYIEVLPLRVEGVLQGNKEEKFIDDEEYEELLKLKKERILKLGKKEFLSELRPLQVELLKMQEYLKKSGERVAIVFEGRDAAGKGSCIKSITEYLDPKYFKIATFGVPSEAEKKNWFKRYEDKLPKPGNMTLYDRSWYTRAITEPVMSYCTEEEYRNFMNDVLHFEDKLIKKGLILIKLWFSIDKETQQLRFELRKKNPLKYWKFSPNDEKALPKWDIFTKFKEQMFEKTSTYWSPWVIVDSNDKRTAKLNAIRYVLTKVPYDDKDESLLVIYPEVLYSMK
jgi:polyphosphate kinase 2